MRKIILLFLLVQLVQPQAWAEDYTLRLRIPEDRVEIRQESGGDTPAVAISRDLTIELQTMGLMERPWTLIVLAMGNLFGEGESIPASAVSWQALTPGFIEAGTLAAGVPQVLARGAGDTELVGRVRFLFRPGEYTAGRYDQVIRFILRSP
ncbi:MAG: hypothetical protein JRG73_19980 [Deltaproteobacteria bacterium]|nr:hypothetical protein [Deltaproteobacteria bacterium]MBW2309207.1 hypothetical protein [Deltaproteobacteria bacterium]